MGPDPEVGQAQAAALQASLKRTLGSAARLSAVVPVRRAVGLHAGLWRLELSDGSCLAAKHLPAAALMRGEPFDPLIVARQVGRLLTGCPIAPVVGVDTVRCLIFYNWAGDETLDDVCQEEAPSAHRLFAGASVDGFRRIREGFRSNRDAIGRAVAPGCGVTDLGEGWTAVRAELAGGLPLLAARYGLSREAQRRLAELADGLMGALAQADPALGTSDYNARNIVVDRERGRVSFLEFEKVGWDWDERRLVQYTTGLGGGLPEGRFLSLLTPEVTSGAAWPGGVAQSDEPGIACGVDGHHLVFHLLAACRLCRALSGDRNDHTTPDLLRFWRRPADRLEQLRDILGRKLSKDAAVCDIRTLLAR